MSRSWSVKKVLWVTFNTKKTSDMTVSQIYHRCVQSCVCQQGVWIYLEKCTWCDKCCFHCIITSFSWQKRSQQTFTNSQHVGTKLVSGSLSWHSWTGLVQPAILRQRCDLLTCIWDHFVHIQLHVLANSSKKWHRIWCVYSNFVSANIGSATVLSLHNYLCHSD